MRVMEIANPEDQLALWRLISDNVWGAFAQQPVWSKIRNTCWHSACSMGLRAGRLGRAHRACGCARGVGGGGC